MNKTRRWYDAYPKLAFQFESLKSIPRSKRDRIISGVMTIIKENQPNQFEQFVLEFPLDINRRRWYDEDPYLWLILNGLRYVEEPLLSKISHYLSGIDIK